MARCTRGYPGFCIRHEITLRDAHGASVTVEYGVADTFFTCPAKATTVRGKKATYGYVTREESPGGGETVKFQELPNQSEAKSAYRESIRF